MGMILRWRLILPILHVLFAAIWVIPEDVQVWKYLPRMQANVEYDRSHPASDPDWENSLDYEYRPSVADRAIHFVDPIPAVLAGFKHPLHPAECRFWLKIIAPVTGQLRLRAQLVVTDVFFVVLVGLQWFLIGRRLDAKHRQKHFGTVDGTSAMVITALAAVTVFLSLVYAATSHSASGSEIAQNSELIAVLAALLAFLTWIIWGVLAAGKFVLKLPSRILKSSVS